MSLKAMIQGVKASKVVENAGRFLSGPNASNASAAVMLGLGGVGIAAGIGYMTDTSYYGRYGMDLGSGMENTLANRPWFGIWGKSPAEASGFGIYMKPISPWDAIKQSASYMTSSKDAALLRKGTRAGAVTGGVIGAAAGLFFGKGTRGWSAVIGGLIGAAAGGYQGSKLVLGMSKAVNDVVRTYHGLNNTMTDRTKVGGGQGYRTWMKRPGGRMYPGHLGASGNLALASHRVRNRSML